MLTLMAGVFLPGSTRPSWSSGSSRITRECGRPLLDHSKLTCGASYRCLLAFPMTLFEPDVYKILTVATDNESRQHEPESVLSSRAYQGSSGLLVQLDREETRSVCGFIQSPFGRM